VQSKLERYAETYKLIGKLELILRDQLIVTLSALALEKGYAQWQSVLPKSIFTRSVGKEIKLGFARQVLSQKYYTDLWVPATHLMFSGLPNASSLKSCQMVENRMHYATQTRNRICHFIFDNIHNVEHEKANLRWLIAALGENS
jgi:hypothetical protein